MNQELLNAIEYIQKEKNIPKEVLIEAIEAALLTAYKKNYKDHKDVRVEINMDTGNYRVVSRKDVVEEVEDETAEIDLLTAREYNPAYEVGDPFDEDITPSDFNRVGAQAAKQAVMQRIRDAEREILYEEFIDKEDELLVGTVDRVDKRFVYVTLGNTDAVLPESERMANETYKTGDRIRVYLSKVEQTTRGPQIYVSRTHPNLLKRLFEEEVPEIYDGTVLIMSVAREAGERSKISVYAENENVDAVGSCVGSRGARVEAIVEELSGEKIDIVLYDNDPKVYVKNALSPSEVVDVLIDDEEKSTTVVVPDNQLSLAIGKRGQNARLAAKLTGWKIDIIAESEYNESEEASVTLDSDIEIDEEFKVEALAEEPSEEN
ncbi:transcription termination factor NusA [Nosocomiicoccus ampullae]|uniref:Transcription termination/antitermination protein NusA n=1 Tax=Nosocomiicoccus ampullae TaxID=489910 RepID=A0A9Q2HFU2_9STAP|nr:transcription termination factor NusA [Nosocomiicoccus ampullae]MBB5176261.1 N utilization substance protein A [Nosocomiicoccus ampullae]QYA47422.1 transcription termination factor NusA [Nosocomiicoccus ampullae]